jgi:hypothetical protein
MFFPTIIVQARDISIHDFTLFVRRSATRPKQAGNRYENVYQKNGEVTYH